MKSNVNKVYVDMPMTPPDGVYDGLWGGYSVTFAIGAVKYRATTDLGVRGMDIPCTITVQGYHVTVEQKHETDIR